MSEQRETITDFNPFLQPYLDFWSSYLEQADETTRRMLESMNGSADSRVWQRRWQQAVSRSADAYLRSPFFLNAMKQNLDVAIKTKLQADDLQMEFARNANIPTASDVSGLFERLRGIEELILNRLGDIEDRLEAIESGLQVDTTDGQGDATPAANKKESRQRARRKQAPRGRSRHKP